MKMITTLLLLTAPLSAASAQRLSPAERAGLEAEVAAGRSIAQDRADALRAYDRATVAMRGIDRTVRATVRAVPGGSAAYGVGGVIGRQGYEAYQRRGRR